jgi:succinate dehydrogenase subunit D
MKLIHKLEPLWWILFGAGGFTACFFLPALLLGILILGPLGTMPGLSYEHAHLLASNPVSKLFLGVVITLVLWHCAHHLRHFILDLGGHSLASVAALLSYGLALAGTIATVSIVAAL